MLSFLKSIIAKPAEIKAKRAYTPRPGHDAVYKITVGLTEEEYYTLKTLQIPKEFIRTKHKKGFSHKVRYLIEKSGSLPRPSR